MKTSRIYVDEAWSSHHDFGSIGSYEQMATKIINDANRESIDQQKKISKLIYELQFHTACSVEEISSLLESDIEKPLDNYKLAGVHAQLRRAEEQVNYYRSLLEQKKHE